MLLLGDLLDAVVRVTSFYFLNSLWIGFGVAVAVAGVGWLFRNASADAQHKIWWTGLIGLLILPAAVAFQFNGKIDHFHRSGRAVAEISTPREDGSAVDLRTAPSGHADMRDDAAPGLEAILWPHAVFGVWLLGVMGMALRLAFCAFRVRVLFRNSVPFEMDLRNPFGRFKRLFAIRRPVRVCASERIASPMVTGVFRFLIFVPRYLREQLRELEFEHVAVHEMGHIYRRDAWGILAQRAAECLLWFHPGVWWISRRIALAREMACDEWVVKTKGDAKAYARSLTRVASLANPQRGHILGIQAVHRRSALLRRIEHLLRDHRLASGLSRWGIGLAALSMVVLGIGFAYLGPLFDVPGRAEAYMRLARYSQAVADIVIGNPLPRGTGRNRRIVVVAEPGDAGALKPVLVDLLQKPILTPQPEQLFELVFVTPEDLPDFQTQKHLILATRAASNGPIKKAIEEIQQAHSRKRTDGFLIEKDVWASTQTVVGLVADGADGLAQTAALNGDFLVSAFESSLSAWLTEVLYHAGVDHKLNKTLSGRFGWRLRVPVGFELMDQHAGDHFVALTRQYDRRQVWVWVYWEKGVSPDALTADWCIEKRDEIGKRFFDGDAVDPTEVTVHETEFGGKLAVCLTGLWENREAWQGGPFKSYALVDVERDCFFLINAGVYAPNRDKALILMQLDALMHTFQLEPVYAMGD